MYETQIEAGMAWMDEHDVPEWKSLIDLDDLNMMRRNACILGQRFADKGDSSTAWNGFDQAKETFHLSEGDMVRLGFDVPPNGSYGQLTTEWIEALKPFRKVAA